MSLLNISKSMSLEDMYFWAEFAAWAVIVGVAIEEVPLWLYIVRFVKCTSNEGLGAAIKRAFRHWVQLVESLGFVILVLGLLFESNFQNAAKSQETELRQASERTITGLLAQAGQAKTELANTTAEARRARSEAGTATERAAKLETQAAQLQRTNLDLQKQVADAQTATADAQAEEERIKSAVVWRVMTLVQCRTVLAAFDSKPRTIELQFLAGDPEALLFAMSIGKCFEEYRHWQVFPVALSVASTFLLNLSVAGRDTEAASALKSALQASGFVVGEWSLDKNRICMACGAQGAPEEADLKIAIGSRPITLR